MSKELSKELSKEFVPHEESLAIKELGFNEPCLGYFSGENFSYCPVIMGRAFPIKKVKNHECLAPLWQQVFDWAKKRFRIVADIENTNGLGRSEGYGYTISVENDSTVLARYGNLETGEGAEPHLPYEEARLNCLKKLIEILQLEECPSCNGNGKYYSYTWKPCGLCEKQKGDS